MKRSVYWFVPLIIIISAIIGFLLHSEYLPENIKKLLIIGSLFGVIGMCASPVDE